MSYFLCTAALKGGTGKTTWTTNVAAALAAHCGLRVLVLDFDGQGDATFTLLGGREADPTWPTLGRVLRGDMSLANAAQASPLHHNLWVVPGSEETSQWALATGSGTDWDHALYATSVRLREEVAPTIDLVLMDTPAADVLQTHVALAAADGIVIVGQPAIYSLRRIPSLLKRIEDLIGSHNPALRVEALVLNEGKRRSADLAVQLEIIRETYGDLLLEPVILDRSHIERSNEGYLVEFEREASESKRMFRQHAQFLKARLGLRAPALKTVRVLHADQREVAEQAPAGRRARGQPLAGVQGTDSIEPVSVHSSDALRRRLAADASTEPPERAPLHAPPEKPANHPDAENLA